MDFTKLKEGTFHRIFEMTFRDMNFRDGFRVIARLPFSNSIPPKLSLESEVATMNFLRLNDIPVPKIYGWDASATNPVGAEYMIMEKADGEVLRDIWYSMDPAQQENLAEDIVRIEKKLFDIQLPNAFGSIYYTDAMPDRRSRMTIYKDQKKTEFCIGPSIKQSWWRTGGQEIKPVDRRPCMSIF